jgi:diguanylate cyclase (GGDEF)-like protein/PAS domain S-box-containing protein
MDAPPLRVLLVEDVAHDAELITHALIRAGFALETRRVESEAEFRAALAAFRPDVVLSDFSMPRFDGLSALAIARGMPADIPFIFVSGTIGEDVAVSAMKSGASDYVMKTNLARLPAVIHRELQEVEVRRGRRRAETALRESAAALHRAQLVAKLAHVIALAGGAVESWSDTLPQLIGMAPGDIPRSTREWLALVHPDDRPEFRARVIDARSLDAHVEVEYRLRRGDGEWIHVQQVIEPVPYVHGADGVPRWFCTLQDVTERKRAERRIQRLNRVYAVLSDINSLIIRSRDRDELYRESCRIAVTAGGFRLAWMGVVDRATMTVVPVARSGLGEHSPDPLAAGGGDVWQRELAQQVVRDGKPIIVDDIGRDRRAHSPATTLDYGSQSLALLPLRVDGTVVGTLALAAPEIGFFDDEEMRLLQELAADISFALDHIAKAETLDYLAYYDALTGLANRTLFLERLSARVQSAGREGNRLALAIFDVDRFRIFNDSLGRRAGDELLKAIANRCTSITPDPELLARVVGDQFVVLVPDADSADNVARIVERRNRAIFGTPFRLEERELRLTAKFGIAVFPDDGGDADTLLRHAEEALRRAKAAGDRMLFYTQRMTERVTEQLALENQLREALEKDEFVLHYQPKVDVATRRIRGVEALLRWASPQRGLVPPLDFISLLEETGMIVDVGAWVLRRAVRDHRRWRARMLAPPRIAVNVSAVQLRHRDFVEMVRGSVDRDGDGAPVIDIEITESVLLENVDATVEKLRSIRAMGLNVAIDDFGTGYSSLGYLSKLPVHALKIDRSFIDAMAVDSDTLTLVTTIISLAHALRLRVIAEGVETEVQAGLLRARGCDEMQGYLIGKPMSDVELALLLQADIDAAARAAGDRA